MDNFDQYFGTEDAETIYSKDYLGKQKYTEFLQYLCDKGVALSVVKCSFVSQSQFCSV